MNGRIHWIDGVGPGRLGTTARPRGGKHLAEEVLAWRREGVGVVASLLTPEEVAECDLQEEWGLCQDHDIQFLSYPIRDRGVPRSMGSALELARWLHQRVAAGRSVLVHCWMGIGRSSLIAASVLVVGGMHPHRAFDAISTARGQFVPDTIQQRLWIDELARHLGRQSGPLRGEGGDLP